MDMTAGSGAGSMTLQTKTSFSDQNQYPVRSSEVVKRVCPPDPCPFGGGGGARDSKVKAMSAARGESPTSHEGEAGGAPGAGGAAEGDMVSGGATGGAGGVCSGGVPSGGASATPPSERMGASGPGEGASGAAQGEPIVVSPEETIEGGTEGIEGGDGFLPPFDVHAAAVVPCGTWIDDAENREWAVKKE